MLSCSCGQGQGVYVRGAFPDSRSHCCRLWHEARNIFGSRACGDNTEDSDYDFLVVPDDDCGMFRLAGFFSKLEDVFGDVDLVCDDPAEGDDFIQRISKDLRLVYEA
ncbi:nucleotidyltransferase family protein [Candidatus Methanoprimaticola sp. MG2]|uniref:nucleotidyltransferase family protein n=1 Tax=Candidatus Methanoprimaticola sp. MG2 TaxID=3228838 RepID=UPI0039C629D4